MSQKKPNVFFDFIRTLIYAVLIAVVVRTVAFAPFSIPSGSMFPTLLVGDFLFVSKYSYGYSQHSLPFSLIPFSGRIFSSEPKRGDTIVFKLPLDNSTTFIKRLIGLPGDTIQMKGGRLFINGEIVPREKTEDYLLVNSRGVTERFSQYIETLPNGVRHRIIEKSDQEPQDNTPLYRVPAEHYFMMGDNRDDSDDSRGIVGYLPSENLVGRAEVIFFSFDTQTPWWHIWKWPSTIRWDRLFDSLRPESPS